MGSFYIGDARVRGHDTVAGVSIAARGTAAGTGSLTVEAVALQTICHATVAGVIASTEQPARQQPLEIAAVDGVRRGTRCQWFTVW